jgi:nucleotide-binding universal stress UspA family protein
MNEHGHGVHRRIRDSSRGLGLLKRSLLGSVSDYILHNSDAPVIVVREEEKA